MDRDTGSDPGSSSRRQVVLRGVGFVVLGVGLLSLGGWIYRVAGLLAIALGVFGLASIVVRRRPGRTDAPRPASPEPSRSAASDPSAPSPSSPSPSSPSPSSTPATPATQASPWEAAASAEAVEPLPESARRRVDAHLSALVDAGALAPDEIETAWLLERLAEEGGDLDGDDLFLVLGERPLRRMTLLEGQVEQTRETVHDEIAELARIAGVPTEVQRVEVTPTRPREMRIEAELTVGDEPVALDYASPAKDLTLDLPVGLAPTLRAAGGLRLAGLSCGDGDVWVAALDPDTDLALLDRHVRVEGGWRGADGGWFWFDEAAIG